MNEDLARDYLQKSGFSPVQADALTQLLAETATQDDVRELGRKMDSMESRLRAEIVRATNEVRADLTEAIANSRADLAATIANSRADLTVAIAASEARLMRWGIALILALSTVFTLLDLFID